MKELYILYESWIFFIRNMEIIQLHVLCDCKYDDNV